MLETRLNSEVQTNTCKFLPNTKKMNWKKVAEQCIWVHEPEKGQRAYHCETQAALTRAGKYQPDTPCTYRGSLSFTIASHPAQCLHEPPQSPIQKNSARPPVYHQYPKEPLLPRICIERYVAVGHSCSPSVNKKADYIRPSKSNAAMRTDQMAWGRYSVCLHPKNLHYRPYKLAKNCTHTWEYPFFSRVKSALVCQLFLFRRPTGQTY